jgi:hypothetical protein
MGFASVSHHNCDARTVSRDFVLGNDGTDGRRTLSPDGELAAD